MHGKQIVVNRDMRKPCCHSFYILRFLFRLCSMLFFTWVFHHFSAIEKMFQLARLRAFSSNNCTVCVWVRPHVSNYRYLCCNTLLLVVFLKRELLKRQIYQLLTPFSIIRTSSSFYITIVVSHLQNLCPSMTEQKKPN